jgi:Tfp pilus assembly protein PilV
MVAEQAGKAVASTIEAMKSTPLAIALLIVNVGFLGFAAYVLGEVAANASERNKTQMELIVSLVKDIRDCRQGPKPTDAFAPGTHYVAR